MEPGIERHHDQEVAPELAEFDLPEKPDGPAAAAVLSAGIGIFVLGLLTTLAAVSESVKGFLEDFQLGQGVGPLAGKTTLAVAAWAASWAVLAILWRGRDVGFRLMFTVGLVLGLAGAVLMFPPVFEALES